MLGESSCGISGFESAEGAELSAVAHSVVREERNNGDEKAVESGGPVGAGQSSD